MINKYQMIYKENYKNNQNLKYCQNKGLNILMKLYLIQKLNRFQMIKIS